MIRKIKKIVRGSRTIDGAGVSLVRVVGRPNVIDFDPFLMLDAFDSTDPKDYIKGFPWHPHRGIETVTYLISGKIDHSDSIGNEGTILDGCCQWMTAGGGIMHQEMPKAADRMLGVQLWLNLPKTDKMVEPTYNDITADMVPKVVEDGAITHIIAGSYKDQKGAFEGNFVKATFLDIDLKPGVRWSLETNPEETLFVYIVEGDGYFEDTSNEIMREKSAVLFTYGNELRVKASRNGMRFFLFSGKPLKESIAWGGPIVMNTQEELNKAFDDIHKGTFIK